MTPTRERTATTRPSHSPPTGAASAKSVALFSSALERVRETSHRIEDRVRDLLLPRGPSIAELRILVVDDHPDSADSLVSLLEIVGCTARACHDAWSAVRAVEEFEPHACLLDLVMPELGGLELAALLKAWAGDRPLLLIATTALGDDQARERTRLAGFHDHLIKPVDPQTLLARISDLWGSLQSGRAIPRGRRG